MALKDIKSITVVPGEEDSTMNLWQSFGWEMKNTQEVKTSESSHLERRGDTIYNVTKAGDHYIKITFERDQSRQNYKELVSLENQYLSLESQYNNISDPGQKPNIIRHLGCGPFFVLIFGAAFIIMAISDGLRELTTLVIGIIVFVLGLISIIHRKASYPNRCKSWEEAYTTFGNGRKEILNKREEVLKQARGLINQS